MWEPEIQLQMNAALCLLELATQHGHTQCCLI